MPRDESFDECATFAYASGKSYVLSATKTVLAKKVEAAFYLHRRRYGSRRITAELAAQGTPVGRFAVRSLMRQKSLQAISARRFVPRTTDRAPHAHAECELAARLAERAA